MRVIRNILYILAAMALMATMSCSRSSDSPEESPDDGGARLKLRLEMPRTVRAGDSHPDWPALEPENAVHDITLFIYNDPGGLNGNPNTSFKSVVYVDKGFKAQNNSVIVDVPMDEDYEYAEGDRITATVNMGNLTLMSTLGALQEYVPLDGTWQASVPGSPSGCSRFTMAAAFDNDGVMIELPGKPGDDELTKSYTASVSVERTAARIDLEYGSSDQEKDGYLTFNSVSCKDELTVNGEVRIYGVNPVNSMQHPSYALKRITEGLGEDMSCFGTWHYTGTLTNGSSRPQAYVLEPRTTLKNEGVSVQEDWTDWYGVSAAATLNSSAWDAQGTLNVAALLNDAKIKFATDNGQGVVVAYTNENTQHYRQHSSKWLTGLLLRAVYVPAKVYADGKAETLAAYEAGQNFWRYRKTNVSTSEDDAIYFTNQAAAEAYAKAHPTDQAEITSYPLGRCYYHFWLRHTVENRDPQIVFPMEYGIVRNHIYRVRLKFRGVGDPTPGIDEPENAEAEIYVRPWNVFRHDTIII